MWFFFIVHLVCHIFSIKALSRYKSKYLPLSLRLSFWKSMKINFNLHYFLWRQSSQGSYCQTRIDCCQKKIGWTRKERRPHVWVVNIRLSCVLIISVAHPLYGNQPQSNKTWQCSLFEMEEGCRKEIGSFLTIILPSASPSSSAVQNLHIPDNRTKKDLIIVWAIWWMCRGI